MPKFKKLNDLMPPKWSIFHQSGTEKSRVVKICDLRRKSLSNSPKSIRSQLNSRKSISSINLQNENGRITDSPQRLKSTPTFTKRISLINMKKENEIDTILGELKLLGKLPVSENCSLNGDRYVKYIIFIESL